VLPEQRGGDELAREAAVGGDGRPAQPLFGLGLKDGFGQRDAGGLGHLNLGHGCAFH
jgi:hypothetical protein